MEVNEEREVGNVTSDPSVHDSNSDPKVVPEFGGDPIGAEGGEAEASMRRPMNAFLIFCKCQRRVVQEQNTHLDNRSVTKILGGMWAAMSYGEKCTYLDMAKKVCVLHPHNLFPSLQNN